MTGSNFFDLGTDLLEAGPWANLGDWSRAKSYQEACRHLAERVGKAAHLSSGNVVLDIACGLGASLDLWISAFGAAKVDAVELRPTCVAAINRRRVPTEGVAVVGDMRAQWQDHPFARCAYDTVISVDAAYHFGSPDRFISLAADTLRPGGRLAFTTIVRRPDAEATPLLKIAMYLARVNPKKVASQQELFEKLVHSGFNQCSVEILDTQVLSGFEKFVAQLPPFPLSPRWWQIIGTARLCRSLPQAYHYVLVSAQRSTN